MAVCKTNLKGLDLVVHYTHIQDYKEKGFRFDIDIHGVFLQDGDKDISGVLGISEIAAIHTACRADAINRMTTGEKA